MKHLLYLLALAVAFLAASLACLAQTNDLEKAAQAEYVGKVLTLRQFYEGSHLRFSADGHLVGRGKTGSWTTDGQIEIDNVHLTDQRLQLKGRRRRLVFDSASEEPRDVLGISASDPLRRSFREFGSRSWRDFVKSANVEVELELASALRDESAITRAMNAVFLAPQDKLADFVATFWRDFLLKQSGEAPGAESSGGEHLFRKGEGISPPRALYHPDPEYSETARRAGYQETVQLRVTVSSSGSVQDVKIVSPVGLGLDEKAVQAVSQWRFDPSRKDGSPVPARINVEVTFRLY